MRAARALPIATLVVAILGVWFALGVAASVVADRRRSPEEIAHALAHQGDNARAEAIYSAAIDRGPVTVPLLIAYLDNHASLVASRRHRTHAFDEDNEPFAPLLVAHSAEDAHIAAILTSPSLAPDVALLGRYWLGVITHDPDPSERDATKLAADAEPPMPWANHLLAREALNDEHPEDAAKRFEREGEHFADRAKDVDVAMSIWMNADDWDEVANRLADPRASARATPMTHLHFALHERRWGDVMRWLVPANYEGARVSTVALALLAAFAWFLFCARAFHLRADAKRRGALFLAAFLLGVLSTYPTIVLAIVEEHALHFVEKGNAIADLIYFILGVGLREESCKLLLFLPLVPFLRKRNDRLDVLACGALVGLGFATEENIAYLQNGALETAIARFLTANFLHISTTALLALAFEHFTRSPDERSGELSRALFMVIAVHGAYDFFLSNEEVASFSFLYVVVFIYLARTFLNEVRELGRGRTRGEPLLRTFAIGMSLVVGSSFAYASWQVGPRAAAASMLEGLIGTALFVFMFVQELSRT